VTRPPQAQDKSSRKSLQAFFRVAALNVVQNHLAVPAKFINPFVSVYVHRYVAVCAASQPPIGGQHKIEEWLAIISIKTMAKPQLKPAINRRSGFKLRKIPLIARQRQ
jgi:hypothetical protein